MLVEELDTLYQEQAQAAITDAVTGLPNHRAVMNRIDEELSRCQRTQSSCAVLFVDLDHFKRINDTWGHRAGDAILHEIASRLHTALRLEDFVGRYGGEEFAIVLAEAAARKLHRSEEEIHLLRLGALLHDIGKIGIPDAILHKPGPLTEDEWVIMRRHPEIGREILEQLGGVFNHLSAIVVAHHERWDGCGYPDGLKEEEIPLCARILSVVDSYDAMTSRRSYREPISSTVARAELQRCSGSQYDPTVVEAFLSVLDDWDEVAICER